MRLPLSLAVELVLLVLKLELESNGCQEGLEVIEEVLLRHSAVEVEEVQHLSFHQIDFSQAKREPIVSLHCSVSCPVFVLRA